MKKMVLVLSILASVNCLAKSASGDSKDWTLGELRKSTQSIAAVEAQATTGELSSDERRLLEDMQANAVSTVVLACQGLGEIKGHDYGYCRDVVNTAIQENGSASDRSEEVRSATDQILKEGFNRALNGNTKYKSFGGVEHGK